MHAFLKVHGLTVEKVVYQQMWDHVCTINDTVAVPFKKELLFAGNPDKFQFVKDWNHPEVPMVATAHEDSITDNDCLRSLGWFRNDDELLYNMRKQGGFGLLWSEEEYWSDYMKLNANYKVSTYLAAGLPVMVKDDTVAAEFVERKQLGFVAESLEDACQQIQNCTPEQYETFLKNVEEFVPLIREGRISEKILSEAIYKTLFE